MADEATAIIALSKLLMKYSPVPTRREFSEITTFLESRIDSNLTVQRMAWWQQSVPDDDFSIISTAIQEFNVSYPQAVIKPMTTHDFYLLFDSQKEQKGDILDLRPFHNRYEHTKAGLEAGPVTYLGYLNLFPAIDGIPHRFKDRSYHKYLAELLEYLVSFLKRAQPLLDLDAILDRLQERFDESFELNLVDNMLDPGLFNTVQEVEVLGSSNLTLALLACGQRSGGRNIEKASRLLALKGNLDASYTERKYINKAKGIPLLKIFIKEACSHLETVLKQTIMMHTV